MQVQLKLFYIVILMYCSITLKQIQFILIKNLRRGIMFYMRVTMQDSIINWEMKNTKHNQD